MPYLGNIPAENYASFDKQTITGNGGTSYTLDHPVGSAQEVAIFVNNVRQEPGVAYTVTGTALTMTGDVESTDDFYAIFIGKAVQTTAVPSDASISLDDNIKVQFGAGNDLQIYHDGSNSYVKDDGTGDLLVQGTQIKLQDASGNDYLRGFTGGAVYLHHAGNNKFETTSTGIDVTGNIGADNPSFKVYLDTNITNFDHTSTGDVVVIYNSDSGEHDAHNTGSHYSTTTGKFTAPVAGVYFFHGAAYSSTDTYGQCWFVKNGSRAAGTDFSGLSSSFQQAITILKLSANDTVGFHPYKSTGTSTINSNDNHTYFTGCLLYQV
jgi:hypothetical protein